MPNGASGIRAGQGLYLSGRYLGMSNGRPYQDRAGQEVVPVKVSLLVGRISNTIEYRSREAAIEALGGVEPPELADVTLSVYAQGPWDPEQRKRGYVFLSGRRESYGGDGAESA